MKRFSLIFISITVMVMMLLVPVLATGTATVTVQSIEEAATIGDLVGVEVSIANNPGFTTLEWLVEYDTERLKLYSFVTSDKITIPNYGTIDVPYLTNFSVVGNINTGKFTAAGADGFTNDAKVLKIVFEIKETATDGNAKVSIKSNGVYNFDNKLDITYVDGYIAVDVDECATGHDYGQWQTRTSTSCETDGLEFRVCQREKCDAEETRVVSKINHNYGSWGTVDEINHKKVCANDPAHVVTEPHTWDNGVMVYICTKCGFEVEVIEPEKEEAVISVSDIKKTRPGETVSFDINLENNTGFTSLGIEIGYDNSIMTLVEVSDVSEIGAVCTTAPNYEKNPYNISWDCTANNTYNGKLATLTFMLNEEIEDGIYNITLDYYKGRNNDYEDGVDVNYDENGTALKLSYKNGEIQIYNYIPGDINDDGKINNHDATAILRYLAGWDVEVCEAALDVDGNGKVNNHDGTALLRYLAGWDVDVH